MAWTPPSLPDSIVLLGGGYDAAAELTAEIVPGKGRFQRKKSSKKSDSPIQGGATPNQNLFLKEEKKFFRDHIGPF